MTNLWKHLTTQRSLTTGKSISSLNFFYLLFLPKRTEISTRKENQRLDLLNAIHTGKGQEVIDRMNAYKLWNGVTTWTNNVLGSKKENSFEFVTFNNGADINLNAYNLVQDVIKNPLMLV